MTATMTAKSLQPKIKIGQLISCASRVVTWAIVTCVIMTLVTCGGLSGKVICDRVRSTPWSSAQAIANIGCAVRGDGYMMFSPEQINTLVRLVDAEIEAEITRICAIAVIPKKYEALLTSGDMEFARQVGISLSY